MLDQTCILTTPLYFASGFEDGAYAPNTYWPLDAHTYDLSGMDRHLTSLSADPASLSISGRLRPKFTDYGGITGKSLQCYDQSGAHCYDANADGFFYKSAEARQLSLYFSFPLNLSDRICTLYEEYIVLPATYAARLAGGGVSHLSGAILTLKVEVVSDAARVTFYDGNGAESVTIDIAGPPLYTPQHVYRIVVAELNDRVGVVFDGIWFGNQNRPSPVSTSLPTNFVALGSSGNVNIDNVVINEELTVSAAELAGSAGGEATFLVSEPLRDTHGHLTSVLSGVPQIYEQPDVPCHMTHIFGGGQRSEIESLKGYAESIKADTLFIIPRLLDDGTRVVITPSSYVLFQNQKYEITGIQDAGGHSNHYQVFGRITL